MLAIEANGLSRRYGRRWAVSDVSFRLLEGKTLLVAGRNGSGKSTLFRMLSTAIRSHSGDALILGTSLTDRDAVRRKVALMTHAPFTYETLTARENLEVPLGFLRGSRQNVSELLSLVGLAERANDRVETFSAGMRKRLMLARTLLQDSPVVLLDEPYGQLDPAGFELIDRLIVSMREEKRTVVIATHLIERVARLADLALVLERGSVLWSGKAEDVLSAHDVRLTLRDEGVA